MSEIDDRIKQKVVRNALIAEGLKLESITPRINAGACGET